MDLMARFRALVDRTLAFKAEKIAGEGRVMGMTVDEREEWSDYCMAMDDGNFDSWGILGNILFEAGFDLKAPQFDNWFHNESS
jgi:hypothetical protein